MKHTYTFCLGIALLAGIGANAQCTTWVNPSPDGGWSDFNTAFNGAPCDDGTGCPTNEITDFQIWADEAYGMANVRAGGTYTFSACNGVGGTAWNISFTVIAPSGAVDAFGLNEGSACALTFTATESGDYLVVVSEEGACGTSSNQAVDNGFPAMTCESSAATMCEAIGMDELTVDNGLQVGPNPSTGLFTLTVSGELSGLEVFDVNGRLLTGVSGVRVSNGVYTLDLSAHESGSYVVRAVVNGQRITERIAVAH